jgi:hypothetical protein
MQTRHRHPPFSRPVTAAFPNVPLRSRSRGCSITVPSMTQAQNSASSPTMKSKGNGIDVVGLRSAASETGASSLVKGGREAGVLFCGLLLRPSRAYTLSLFGGRRAAEAAGGRRGSVLLRCCLQSAFPESLLPHLLIRTHKHDALSVDDDDDDGQAKA